MPMVGFRAFHGPKVWRRFQGSSVIYRFRPELAFVAASESLWDSSRRRLLTSVDLLVREECYHWLRVLADPVSPFPARSAGPFFVFHDTFLDGQRSLLDCEARIRICSYRAVGLEVQVGLARDYTSAHSRIRNQDCTERNGCCGCEPLKWRPPLHFLVAWQAIVAIVPVQIT
jgi:hypothetical protein